MSRVDAACRCDSRPGLTARIPYVAAATTLLLLVIGISRLLYPYDLGHYEAGLWQPSLMLVTGTNPYARVHAVEPPYVACPYGPVYYTAVGLGLRWFGYQFWAGRLLSLLGLLGCMACVGTLAWRFTRSRRLGLLAVLLFGAQLPVQGWPAVQKPDLLALAFVLLGLTWTIHPSAARRPYLSTLGSAVMLALAILCRQTSILPVAVVCGWFFFNKNYKQLALFAVSWTAMMAVSFTLFDCTSQGGFSWQMYLLPFSVSRTLGRVLGQLVQLATAPTTEVAAIAMVCLAWRSRLGVRFLRTAQATVSQPIEYRAAMQHSRFACLWWGYFVLSLMLTLVTASRAGSNLNYWLETCAVVAVLIPVAWHNPWRPQSAKANRRCGVLVLALLVSALVTGARVLRAEYYRWQARPYMADIIATIAATCPAHAPCFSIYPELVIYAGRECYFSDFVQYDGRSPQLQRAFHTAIEKRMLFALVTESPTPPPGYHRVPLTHGPPQHFGPAFLHIRD